MTKTNAKLTIALIVVLALCLSLLMCSIFSGGTIIADAEGSDLQSMVDEIEEGGTITLSSNVVLTQALSITTTNSFTLDLNGYAISRSLDSAVVDGYVIYVDSDATVTITSGTDEDGDGEYTAIAGTITGGNNTSYGGGINNAGTLTINNISITDNTAYWGGGIYSNSNSTLNINYSTISDNTAGNGGGVYVKFGTVNINYSTISDNTAIDYGNGGGIYNKGTVYLDSSTLTGNATTSSLGSAGGIYQGDTLYIYGNTTVIGNYNASGSAYNIFLTSGETISFSDDNSFTGIIGVCGNEEDISATWSTAHTGTVQYDTSGYYVAVSDNTLTKTSASATVTTSAGTVTGYDDIDDALDAAKGSAGSTLTLLDDVTLTSSISITTSMTIDLNGYEIDRNLDEATTNGYVINSSGTVTITSGVYIEATGTYSADMGTITGGNNTDRGGGIYNKNGTLTISNIEISGNTASTYGGGIYVSEGTVTITDSIITGNTADTYGGGIHSYSTLIISGSTITGNTASVGGGVYMPMNTQVNITDSTISYNTASTDGGGMYLIGAEATITNSTVSYNTAGSGAYNYGGGIYNNGTLYIYGSTTVTDNVKGGTVSGNVTNGYTLDDDGTTNNIHLASSMTIDFSGTDDYIAFTGNIGVTHASGLGSTVSTTWSSSHTGTVTSDDTACYVAVTNSTLTLEEYFAATVTINGAVEYYSDFGSALTDAQGSEGSTLTLLDNVTLSSAIVISTNMTLDLNGFTIDRGLAESEAADNGYVIYVDSDATVTITSGTDEDGDGEYTANAGTITGGNNTDHGGGIYNAGTLTIDNIEISGNTSIDYNYGGGIYNAGTLQINDCIIKDNEAFIGGGIFNAYSEYGELTITSSTISGNTANSGGGISNGDTLTVDDCTIEYNSADMGGGVENYDAAVTIITDSIIRYNSASSYGGGLYINSVFEDPIYINGDTYITNNVVGGEITNNEGNYSLAGSNASNVYIDYVLDGVYIYYNISFDAQDPFTGEIGVTLASVDLQGENYYSTITTSWNDCHTGTVSSDNTSYSVVVTNSTLTLEEYFAATVTINGAVEYYSDFSTALTDALAAAGSTLTLLDNVTLNSAIVISTNMTLDLNGYTIDRNLDEATASGYVISIGSSATVTITSGVYIEDTGTYSADMGTITGGNNSTNTTTASGGGILNTGTLTLYNISISGNTGYYGGGIFNNGSSLYVEDCSITDNTASTHGGGIALWANTNTATITNTTISNNTVGGNFGGGIILWTSSITLNIYGDTIITDNYKTDGTSNNAYLMSGTVITFDDTADNAFTGTIGVTMAVATANISTTYGGTGTVTSDKASYYVSGSDTDTLTLAAALASVTIDGAITYYATLAEAVDYANDYTEDNSDILITMLDNADITAGLIFSNTTNAITLDMAGCTIDRGLTEAEEYGYVIKVNENVTLTITSGTDNGNGNYSADMGTITGGYNSGTGGGIYNYSGTLTISNISIIDNSAKHGGGIYNAMYSENLTIEYSTISGNTASSDGGGISTYGETSITNSIITDNTGKYGGGVDIHSTASITNSTISGNEGTSRSGGIEISSAATVIIDGCTISGNTAGSGGGGGIINYGTVVISNSTISGNTAATISGGGIFTYGTLYIYGSTTVTGNANSGTVSGDLSSGYTVTGGTTNNVYLYNTTIEFYNSEDSTGYSAFTGTVGVTMKTAGQFSSTWDSVGTGATVTSDSDSYVVLLSTTTNTGDTLALVAVLATVTIGDDVYSFGSLADAVDYANGYTDDNSDILITMLGNADTSSTGVLEFTNTDNEIILDMAGFTINRGLSNSVAVDNGSVIIVNADVTLTITSSTDGAIITGGYSSTYGGGIYNLGTLTISNISISGNKASTYGGGIYNDYGTLTIEDSEISDNTANNGGGIYSSVNSQVVSITNSTISGNTANNGGGIYCYGGFAVYGGEISDNYAKFYGGGIYNNGGTLTIEDAAISDNTAGYDGGGICNYGTLTIEDATISGNTAGYDGGGIYNYGGSVTIQYSTIQYNSASNGGGIYNTPDSTMEQDAYLTITDSTIQYNTAGYDGGGICNFSQLTIGGNTTVIGNVSGGTVSGNATGGYTLVGGSANNIYLLNSSIAITFSSSNKFTGSIGVTMWSVGQFSTTYNNVDASATVTSDSVSRYVSASSSTASLVNYAVSVKINDTVTYYATLALAVTYANEYSYDDSDILITMLANADTDEALIFSNTDNTITLDMAGFTINRGLSGEEATASGYVISIGASVTVAITSTSGYGTITGGNTTDNGGGLRVSGTLTISNVIITGNTAVDGGGIYSMGGYLTIDNCSIKGNTATNDGGGIRDDGEMLTIANSTITGNTASNEGGGIWSASSSRLTITNTTISSNTAGTLGGGLYTQDDFTIGGDTCITGNTVADTDNNIYLTSNTTITFDDTADNQFTGKIGVTMYSSTGQFTSTWDTAYEGTVFSDNAGYYVAVSDDGTTLTLAELVATVTVGDTVTCYSDFDIALSAALGSAGSTLTLYDDVILTGGIDITTNMTLDLNGYTIDRALTTAEADGYVIYIASGVTVTITSGTDADGDGNYTADMGTITGGNSSSYTGGGIYNRGTLYISNISIAGNNAANYGGGIYVNSGTVTITDSTITGNTADNGGGIYSYGTLIISGSTISGNAASYGGGVCMSMGSKINITDSTISYNTASSHGGGMYLNGTEATITNSTVSCNTAGSGTYIYGGGIYVSSGTLYIYGSTTVTDNVKGGTVSGDSIDNYSLSSGGTTNNIYLNSNKTITFSGIDDYIAFTGSIGVTMATAGLLGSGWNDDDFTGDISSDASGYTLVYSGTDVYLVSNSDNYTITYVIIESITTHSNTATSYKVTSSTITLTEATVTGATFLGWYDASGNEVTSIESGSFGDIALYAYYSVTAPSADSNTYTYNDDEQTYGISSTALYTVSGNTQTDAGTHTVTVTLVDYCYWADTTRDELTFDFVIGKAISNSITEFAITDWAYGDDASAPTATADFGTITYTYYYDVDCQTVVSDISNVNAGTYYVVAAVAETTNYAGATIEAISFTIAKATYTGITHDEVSATYTTTLTLADVSLNSDYSWVTDSTSLVAGTASYSAIYNADSDNYNNFELTISVAVAKATVDAPSADSNEFVYTGSQQTYALDTSTLYTVSDNTTQTDAGTYTITVSLTDSDNYTWADNAVTSFDFVIAKAIYDMSDVTFVDSIVTYDGNQHTITISGSLPTGVEVSYTDNALTNAGSVEVTASFTGDSDNYELIDDITATLTVAKAVVTIDGTTTGFATLADAVDFVNDYTDDYKDILITMLYNADTDEALIFSNTSNKITLDMAGFEIDRGWDGSSSTKTSSVIIVNSNVALTITSTSGTGTISGGYATDGGGIYNLGTLIVSYVEISGNKASSCGGGIYNLGTLTVSYVEISDNHASSNGGGIYNSNGTVKLDYVVITGNTAGSSNYGGGGIYNYCYTTTKVSLSITNSTISDNTSSKSGGGVYIYSGVANIIDSIITGNTASSYSGGGVYVNTATVTLDNVDISYNTAKNGGGVYVYDGTLVLDNTDITYNTASSSGGGIFSYKALTIYGNTTVIGNVLGGTVSGNSDDDNYSLEGSTANNIYSLGFIVFDDEDDNAFTGKIGMTMFTSTGDFSSTWDTAYEGTVFSDNAGYYVAVSDDGTTLTLAVARATVTIGDDVYSFGSLADAVSYANGYTDEDNSDILITMLGDADTDEALIFSNTSNAITLDMAGYTIDRGLTGLDAVTNGYVIKVNSRTTVTITSNVATMGTITGGNNSNDYSTAGGGINNYGTLTISNVNITGNTAKYGGGINNYGSSADLTIEYSIISGNTANTIGGGVYNNDYAKLSINSSTITDNTADLNGGGVYIGSGTAYIYGSTTVTGNTAKYGGGIYSHNGALTIINSTISYNTASSGGGGIYVYGGTAYITDSTISYNTTSNVADGGGIYVYGGTLSIYGSTTVTGNVSGGTVSGDLSSGYTISGVTTNNIYLINGTTIVFSGTDDDKTAFTGAIGVTMAVTSGNISTTWDSADTGTVTSDRSSYRVNASADGTTLTLVFVSYVTFDSNGGSSTSTVVADINTAITAPDAPTYSGYTFVYWTDSTGAEFDFDTVIAEDITLTAKWALDSYSITYVVISNITGTNSNATSYTVVDYDITLSDVEVTGAIFLGWFDSEGNEVTSVESGSFGNIILYAYYSVTAPSADSTEFVYSGSEQTYGISSTDLYTVSGNTQTDAGTHTVTVSLADNCYWADTTTADLTFDFVIAKATISVTDDVDDWTFGDDGAPTISTEFGTEEILYTGTTNGGVAYSSTTAPTEAGDYTVTVTVAGTSDYDGIEESYDFTIERAAGSVEVIIDEDWTYGDTLGDVISYSTSTNNTSDVVVEYRIYTMVRTMSLSTTTEWSTVAPTNAGTYEVRVTYSQTDNYYEVVYEDTFTIAQVSVAEVTPTATGITYGNTLADSALSGVASVDGSWSWDNSSIAPSVSDSGVTAYTAVFTPSDSVNYMGFTVEVTVTVAKATYDMSGVTFADLSVTYSGTAHTVAISGELPAGVSVSYTGNSNTEVGTYTVTASFVGDADNYEAIADMTATVTITAVVVDDADTDTDDETNSLWWVIAILSVIVVTEAIFIMGKLRKNKKKNNSTRTYSAAPLALLLAIPMGETIAIAVLAVLAVAGGVVLAVMYAKSDKQAEQVTVVSQPKPVVVTPSGLVEEPIAQIAPVTTTSEQDGTPVQDGALGSAVTEDNMPAKETAQQGEQSATAVTAVQTATVTADSTTEGAAAVVPGVMAMSTPRVASDDEVGFGGIDEVTGKAIIIRYSKSFTAKFIQSTDDIKQYYTALKNALHSYNGVKSRVSWKYDSIVQGRVNLAKFAIKGKSLYLYLALDASQFDGTKYKVTAPTAKLYEKTPCLYKVSGPRKLKQALELIAILAEQCNITQGSAQSVDYSKPYESTAALLEQKLIKELISKKKYEQYMDKFGQHQTGERRIVSAQEVDSLMSTEQATAELQQSTQQYASEVASTASSSSAIVSTNSAVTYRVKGNVTAIINVDTLSAKFADGDTVDLQSLKAKGLIAKNTAAIKVLARGSCDKSLTVIAHQYSIQAVKMILLTGGTAVKVSKK